MSIEVHTICKNSADFLELCLKQVIPYVDIVRLYCDKDSEDGTDKIAKRLSEKNENIKLTFYEVKDPIKDLVAVRNKMLDESIADWIWILDDDEFYTNSQIEEIKEELARSEYNAYALPFWFILDKNHYHPQRSKSFAERFFRNKDTLEWKGNFSREAIHDENGWMDSKRRKDIVRIPEMYIHLSYLKKYSWRDKFGKKKFLYPDYNQTNKRKELPENIKTLLQIIL